LKYEDIDLVTPRLDGTILPGVTRSSILALGNSHSSSSPIHPSLPGSIKKVHALERTMHMSEVGESYSSGKLMEVFGCSTAAVVVPIGRIGYQGQVWTMPVHEGGLGPVARAFFEKITDIQEGKEGAFGGWSVPCTS
jgi:branched-chain amino acid aminotransferase